MKQIDIFNAEDNVLIFGIRNPIDEIEDITKIPEFGPPITHSRLMMYDLENDTLSEILKFKEPTQCYDLLIKDQDIIITYSTHKDDMENLDILNVNCHIGKIKEDEIIDIDSFIANLYYNIPYLTIINDNIYYSYDKKVGDREVFGINKILDEEYINIVEYEEFKLLNSTISSNGKEMMLFVDEGKQAFFYIFNEEGFLFKKPLDLNKRVFAYNLLSDGIIISCEEKDSDKYYIEFFNFKSDEIIQKHIGPIYNMVGNSHKDCMAIGESFNLNYIRVTNNEIINTYIDIHNEIAQSTANAIRVYSNNKNIYGVYFEDLGIYANIIVGQ